MTRPVLSLLAASAAALLAACAWSVPADPGLVVECRPCGPGPCGRVPAATPGAPVGRVAADDGARAIYLDRCSRCHEAFPPSHATPAQWPIFVRKYGPRAGLFGEERERVIRWLQANSR